MLEQTTQRLLARHGTACTVIEQAHTRTSTNGVTTTTTNHTGLAYEHAKKQADGLNPNVTKTFLVLTTDGYLATTKDKLSTISGEYHILSVEAVASQADELYQVVGV